MTAEAVDLGDARRDRLLMRRHQLRTLLERVTAELAAVEEELDPAAARAERERRRVNETQRAYRARRQAETGDAVGTTSEWCESERGYHWHRTHGPWPLPPDDPCGCRAAHAAYVRDRRP
jgi:hypothetical protein